MDVLSAGCTVAALVVAAIAAARAWRTRDASPRVKAGASRLILVGLALLFLSFVLTHLA